MKKSTWVGILGLFIGLSSPGVASALELDWSGQFWYEFNYIHDYTMDTNMLSYDQGRAGAGGYYIPAGGTNDAMFQTAFLRLRPKVIVNDNIFIKSEIWFSDPIFGIFGSSTPVTNDQNQYYSSQSRGSVVRVQRFWGEFLTDLGTVQLGRVPLNWGLGIVWDSGDALWSRYMSSGDAVRWIAKFGSFSFIPSIIVNSTGNSIGGNCIVNGGTTCTPGGGAGGVVDYSIVFKYENIDDELEAGVNLIKRLAGAGQDLISGLQVPSPSVTTLGYGGQANLLTYDFYARKKFNQFTLKGEVPVVSGSVGNASVNTFAIALEAAWKPSDTVEFILKTGYAPGESNLDAANLSNATGSNFSAFYFNPNYHVGMIMFNYQLANFALPQTLNNPNLNPSQLRSPYDNPIVNASYFALSAPVKPWDKWTLTPAVIYAAALQTAQASSQSFYNHTLGATQTNQTATDQGSPLGLEIDLGLSFQWDDNFLFTWDNGILFPGSFYAFSNSPTQQNATSAVFATSIRVGVNF